MNHTLIASAADNGNFERTVVVETFSNAVSIAIYAERVAEGYGTTDAPATLTPQAAHEVGTALIAAAKKTGYVSPIEALNAPPPPKSATLKGEQVSLGNDNHAWEGVTINTERLRVPGGWLYNRLGINLVFVPVPDAVGYAV